MNELFILFVALSLEWYFFDWAIIPCEIFLRKWNIWNSLTQIGLQLDNSIFISKKFDKIFKVYALTSRLVELGSVPAFLINY